MAQASVTFQVLEGIDKGRVFRELPVPVTIGREEGNSCASTTSASAVSTPRSSSTATTSSSPTWKAPTARASTATSCRSAGCASATASASAARCCCSAPTRRSPPAWRAWPASVSPAARLRHAGKHELPDEPAATGRPSPARSTMNIDFDLNLDGKPRPHRATPCSSATSALPPLAAEDDAVAGRPPRRDPRLPAPRPDAGDREHPGQGRRHAGHARVRRLADASWPCRCCWRATSAWSPSRRRSRNDDPPLAA